MWDLAVVVPTHCSVLFSDLFLLPFFLFLFFWDGDGISADYVRLFIRIFEEVNILMHWRLPHLYNGTTSILKTIGTALNTYQNFLSIVTLFKNTLYRKCLAWCASQLFGEPLLWIFLSTRWDFVLTEYCSQGLWMVCDDNPGQHLRRWISIRHNQHLRLTTSSVNWICDTVHLQNF